MRGQKYIYLRQKLWGQRHDLRSSRPGYTRKLKENLFQPLSKAAWDEFEEGDGNELGTNSTPGKMQALHSSSAIGCNVFDYWKSRADSSDITSIEPIAEACGLPRPEQANSIFFEQKRKVLESPNRKIFRNDPNLDVVITYRSGAEVGIECKFSEAYSGGHSGLKRPYLQHDELKKVWTELPKTYELAKTISPDDKRFKYLHAAQLIKHILGLKHRSDRDRKRPRLLSLWYDVPGEEGVCHQCEIERFTQVVDADGVWFRAIRYQDVIRRLATKYREEPHQAYVDYLAERYL